MRQVTVPQFLDVEDKIIGPITVRQFIELLVGGLFVFIFYKTFDFSLFVVSSLVMGGVVLIVAFAKINGQAFHYFFLNLIATLKRPKLQVWRKKVSAKADAREEDKSVEDVVRTAVARPAVGKSRLSELSLVVDTGGVYHGEGESDINLEQ